MIIKAKSYFATPFLQMSFPGILSLSHPRASIARPGDLLDCRVKPGNDKGGWSSYASQVCPVSLAVFAVARPLVNRTAPQPPRSFTGAAPHAAPEHDGEAGEHDGGMKRQSMTKKER